ncbi:hypothetical protein [Sinomicrobium oceani]|uniref:hypothetical protein n=1 Tax=Sinomicrobium oceani TaxID=1150368 RepID=UPI00227C8228|nr:hypothetical protein [Sinomicrobium oceani]
MNFIPGALAQDIGALLLYMTCSIFTFASVKAAVFTMSLVLFMETTRCYLDEMVFDIYDILALALALLTVWGFEGTGWGRVPYLKSGWFPAHGPDKKSSPAFRQKAGEHRDK